ncbi:MAG: hypothetical protein AAGI28_00720 [Pseudomonadota bacterium]
MLRKIGRLFVIKNRVEAFAIIYALALGATNRGLVYLDEFPPYWGEALFLACCIAVLMAGAAILDSLRTKNELGELKAQLAEAQAHNTN